MFGRIGVLDLIPVVMIVSAFKPLGVVGVAAFMFGSPFFLPH